MRERGMDPNETLRRARAHAEALLNDELADWAAEAEPLAGLFQALDGWLSGGGALPEAWDRDRSDPLLTYSEAAEVAGVAAETWRVLVRDGYAPGPDEWAPVKRWRRSSVEAFKAARPGRGRGPRPGRRKLQP